MTPGVVGRTLSLRRAASLMYTPVSILVLLINIPVRDGTRVYHCL